MNIVPAISNRIALPTLPSGRSTNFSECEPPKGNLPIVPGLPMFTTKRLPSRSAAGPSIPKVYSPAGVTCLLSNNFGSAQADVAVTENKNALQKHQKRLFDVIAICIGAIAVEELIRRFVKTAVIGVIYGLSLCHHDDLRRQNLAALLVAFAEKLP